MTDILTLRDCIWVIRIAGWIGLYYIYINRLEPRFPSCLAAVGGLAAMTGLTLWLHYYSLPLVQDTAISGLIYFTGMLLIKKTDWRNALYGALTFTILSDLVKIIGHDLIYVFLFEASLTARWISGAHLIYTFISLLLGLGGALLLSRLVFGSDKRLFSIGQMIIILVPGIVYFYARNTQFSLMNELGLIPEGMLHLYMLLILLGVSDLLISLLADNNLSTRLQRKEIQGMQELMQKQQQEFMAQKSAVDAVNQKYHDLKNLLLAFQTEGEKEQSFVEALQQQLQPFEALQETGNEYLNIVIAEKMRICQQKGVRLTPYVDGRAVSFIDGMDLCVIVGNALDNAVEAVMTLEADKREIHVKIARTGNLALMSFRNCFSGKLEYDNAGHVKSSKTNADGHGYGLKGIGLIVDKYKGSIAIDTSEDEFALNILMPVSE